MQSNPSPACAYLFSRALVESPTVDDRHGNTDDAVEVDTETGVLRKAVRPGMGTILARERVGENTKLNEN